MSPRWDLHQPGRIFIIPLGSSSFCWDYHHPAGIFIIPLGSSHPARTIIIIIQLGSLSPSGIFTIITPLDSSPSLWDLHHHHPAGIFTTPLGSSSPPLGPSSSSPRRDVTQLLPLRRSQLESCVQLWIQKKKKERKKGFFQKEERLERVQRWEWSRERGSAWGKRGSRGELFPLHNP